MLVKENLCTCAQYLIATSREESYENRAKTHHNLVIRGKLRAAVRRITEHETGGLLHLEDPCTKTGDRVMEVLHTKHLDAHNPSVASLDTYMDRLPEFVPVDITNNTVTEVAGRIFEGVGTGERTQ